MDTVSTEKNRIRREMRVQKAQLSDLEKGAESKLVFERIETFSEFISARTILIYWSLYDELPTQKFIEKWKDRKNILLPVVVGDILELGIYKGNNSLKIGNFGISEPEILENFVGEIDLVIVPGMAFDQQKNRLGRGKGFYDRFLKRVKAPKWGVCFNFQLIKNVPTTLEDVKMDKVISADKVF